MSSSTSPSSRDGGNANDRGSSSGDPGDPATDLGRVCTFFGTDTPPFDEMLPAARRLFAFPGVCNSLIRSARRLQKFGALSAQEATWAADFVLRHDRKYLPKLAAAIQVGIADFADRWMKEAKRLKEEQRHDGVTVSTT